MTRTLCDICHKPMDDQSHGVTIRIETTEPYYYSNNKMLQHRGKYTKFEACTNCCIKFDIFNTEHIFNTLWPILLAIRFAKALFKGEQL